MANDDIAYKGKPDQSQQQPLATVWRMSVENIQMRKAFMRKSLKRLERFQCDAIQCAPQFRVWYNNNWNTHKAGRKKCVRERERISTGV